MWRLKIMSNAYTQQYFSNYNESYCGCIYIKKFRRIKSLIRSTLRTTTFNKHFSTYLYSSQNVLGPIHAKSSMILIKTFILLKFLTSN